MRKIEYREKSFQRLLEFSSIRKLLIASNWLNNSAFWRQAFDKSSKQKSGCIKKEDKMNSLTESRSPRHCTSLSWSLPSLTFGLTEILWKPADTSGGASSLNDEPFSSIIVRKRKCEVGGLMITRRIKEKQNLER